MAGRPPYSKPDTRPLRVYAFDPSVGNRLDNFAVVRVPYEELSPGPVGGKIAVIDYDVTNERYYWPADLDDPRVLIGQGLPPSESDPRFHQQMVYALVAKTVARFEFALGREVSWRPRATGHRNDPYRTHLRVFPHAFQQANAFYDCELRALLFGYFAASKDDAGDNLPGQTVFTCLSHDIVVHETTHAVIDSIRAHFSEPTSIDPPAFHEAFADLVALFQHFTMPEPVYETISRTGGLIHRKSLDSLAQAGEAPQIAADMPEANPLIGLAKQFGEAIGTRKALREAIGEPPDPAGLAKATEPHKRGAILVAAVFEAYFNIYVQRTRDLLRIGRAAGGPGDLHPDLVRRLTSEAIKIAEHFLNICIRAIDYCPPVDLQFGEFLRAIITADSDLVPSDPHGYRMALIAAFRRRGIVPGEVGSYSEESLRWSGPAELGIELEPCKGLLFDIVRDGGDEAREANAARQKCNAQILHAFATAHAAKLGLSPDITIQAYSFHPIFRIGPTGRLVVEFVVEFLQQRELPVDPALPKGGTFKVRGGSTVIFSHLGEVKYIIKKNVCSDQRAENQRHYLAFLRETGHSAYNSDVPTKIDFAAIHRGG